MAAFRLSITSSIEVVLTVEVYNMLRTYLQLFYLGVSQFEVLITFS